MTTDSSSQPVSRKEFFVDTKTTCFLCLKDIPSTPLVIDLENDEEDGNQEDTNLEGEKFYMKPIFRYLNVHTSTLFRNQLALQDSTKLLKRITDWKVLLCRECIPKANRVSELCLELEMIQMKMNHSINVIQEIIDNSEKDAVKIDKFRRKLTSPLESFQATIADLLRNETREKCTTHFKKSSPKVDLKTFQEPSTAPEIHPSTNPTLPLPPPPPSTVSRNVMKPACMKCKLCGVAFGARGGLIGHMQRRHPEVNYTPDHNRTPKGRIKCHICKSVYMLKTSLRRHMKNYHSENPKTAITCNKCGLQLPSRPDLIKHIRLYCSSVGRTNTVSSSSQDQLPPPPALHPLQPPPPPISVGSENPLTTVNLSKMIDSIPHSKAENGGLLCALCPNQNSSIIPNEVFQREDLLRRHMFLNHLDYFFGPLKLPEVSSDQFKIFCKEIVENDMKPTQSTGVPGSGRFGSLTFACTHCSSTFYEKRAMNAHLIRSHYSILAPKLVDIQRNQDANIREASPTPVEAAAPVSTYSERKYKCEDCSTSFKSSGSLQNHQMYACKVVNLQATLSHAGKAPMVPLIEHHLKRFRKKRKTEEGYPGKHCCAECHMTFAHRTSLLRHRSTTNHKIDAVGFSHQPVAVPETAIPSGNMANTSFNPPQWSCQHCGNKFSSSSSMYRHLRQSCPFTVAKGGNLGVGEQTEQSGVTVYMEGADQDQNYFYESTETEEEMGIEGQVEYEEEAYPESYVNTKIEVIEMDQAQFLPKMEQGGGGGQLEVDGYQDNLMVSEGGGGEDEEMILP